jgi:hypothetical protein
MNARHSNRVPGAGWSQAHAAGIHYQPGPPQFAALTVEAFRPGGSSFLADELQRGSAEGETFMKILGSTTLTAALVMSSISLAQAAPRAKDVSPPSQARVLLEEVNGLARSMTVAADRLAMDAKGADMAEVELARLEEIKDDANQIGKYLRTLEKEEGSLSEWERNAIDSITPLMVDAAKTTDQAFKTYDPNRRHLWATPFPAESAEIYKDASKVNEIVGGYLKLAALHEHEQHIEAAIGGSH